MKIIKAGVLAAGLLGLGFGVAAAEDCVLNAATLVEQQVGQNSIVLKGTTVCVLRVVQTDKGVAKCDDGSRIVAVRARIVNPGYNVDAVVVEETYFCSSQLAGK